MSYSRDKSSIARSLAEAHQTAFPEITMIIRVVGEEESSDHEPVKLLEVNPETTPSGIVPVFLGPLPPKYPYPSVIIEVTEEEYSRLLNGDLKLPENWRLEETLFAAAA